MSNQIDVTEELGRNFLIYALDVDQNKAFPSVADGLAPGARAALWEMYASKYFSNKPHVKSAKVAAGVIGRWWPHNADASYGTLVRMAQPFIENCLEVDFQGAVGNQIIGQDSAGASRYTEMRLSKLAEDGLFYGVNKNNCDMIWNYLQDEKWPKTLPAIFPRLLVNGHIGLGVGMSTYFTLHSFTETADIIFKYLSTGEVDNDNYFPDFPTGGVIINKNELGIINKTGKGRIIVQGRYKVKNNQIIFYEFPYQVYIEPLIGKIKEAYNKEQLPALEDVINSSDKHGISITITVANGYTPEQCVNQLFANTPLQTTYHVNQNAIINQVPEQVNLEKILQVYVQHNTECIKREYQFDLEAAQKRIHILEGLSKALEDIDNIINLIKNSKDKTDAAKNLKEKYNLTNEQVDAILKMTLSRLANMEQIAIAKELQEKKELALLCQEVVESYDKQKDILIERLRELVKKYGDKRRTEVTQKEIAKPSSKTSKKEVVIQDTMLCYTEQGYVKNIPIAAYRSSEKYKFNFKTRTDEMILLFSSLGKVYRIKVSEIKFCGLKDKGVAIGALINLEPNEQILLVTSMNIDEKHPYITGFTKEGMVKKSDKTIYISSTQNKNGFKGAGLKENDVFIAFAETNGDYVIINTQQKWHLQFKLDEINTSGKTAKGVIGIKLHDNDYVTNIKINPKENNNIPVRHRATFGVQ